MPCYTIRDKSGKAIGTLCGKLGPHCPGCGAVGDFLCDYPVGAGKTCDRPMCEHHAHEVTPDIHYCVAHYSEWLRFRESGGVVAELANVVPYKGRRHDHV